MGVVMLIGYPDEAVVSTVLTSVVELEPGPPGAETFGRSRYTEVSAPAPGQTKVVFKNHNSY
jgi:hypothetical protein